jgi:EAL domain-containing protein (putative c-di-GMP-specific phosphodiesterase class I)
MGIFTAVFLTTAVFIVYDRLGRTLWENAMSWQMKKLNAAQDNIAAEVKNISGQMDVLKTRVLPSTAVRPRAEEPTPLRSTPARKTIRLLDEDDDHDTMPLAIRPGTIPAKRAYGDLIEGQHELSDLAVRNIMNDALQGERVEMFLQPIVRLPQRKVRFYELFARLRARPGLYVSAARYLPIAKDAVMDIDRLLIAECLDILRETAKVERAAPFFININPNSLKNGAFMKKLLAFLSTHNDLAARLVFEISQREFLKMSPGVVEIVKALGQLGCTFSIDNVDDFTFDVGALLKLRVRFVKISAQALVNRSRNERQFAETLKVKRKLEGNGIAVIAEKIESDRMVKELFDFDINYGQGYLFGRPDVQGAYAEKAARRSTVN